MNKLLIAVTFFFNSDRLKYLHRIASQFPNFCCETKVIIVTNSHDSEHHQMIIKAVGGNVEIIVPTYLGHPYLLPWLHFDSFKWHIKNDSSISHFCYLEDDIELKKENLEYWVSAREELRSLQLIPSFLRYEITDGEFIKRSTDVTSIVDFEKLPRFQSKDENLCFINLPQPYQGMYLLDKELAEEHFFGPSSSPDFGTWGIREKATQGLTFSKVPKGCFSRNFLAFNKSLNLIEPSTLIHHTPNNYANNPKSKFGKIPIDNLIKVIR